MIRWLRSRFSRRPDIGLQLHARQFGTKPPNAERYDYDKAIAAKRKAEQRQAAVQKAQQARTTRKAEQPRLRAIK